MHPRTPNRTIPPPLGLVIHSHKEKRIPFRLLTPPSPCALLLHHILTTADEQTNGDRTPCHAGVTPAAVKRAAAALASNRRWRQLVVFPGRRAHRRLWPTMDLIHFLHSSPVRRCGIPRLFDCHTTLTAYPASAFSLKSKSRPGRCLRRLYWQQGGQLGGLSLRCSSSSSQPPSAYHSAAAGAMELPLFPLPLVLFPGAILPLQIFEFRYRILMHTLLETDLRFGVVFSDAGAVAGVGCVGEVVKHERLVDDRFFLICKGQERFHITRVVRTKPYLVAEVAWLEDRPPPPGGADEEEDVETLATEVERYMRDVIRISNRLNGKTGKEGSAAAADLRRGLFPTPFSFFVGSTFEGAPREQQALLELQDTGARLKRERDTLRNTLSYLTAASAVKDAFPSSPSSPPP